MCHILGLPVCLLICRDRVDVNWASTRSLYVQVVPASGATLVLSSVTIVEIDSLQCRIDCSAVCFTTTSLHTNYPVRKGWCPCALHVTTIRCGIVYLHKPFTSKAADTMFHSYKTWNEPCWASLSSPVFCLLPCPARCLWEAPKER